MVAKALLSSNSDEWTTPLDLYRFLDDIYHFELDPATTCDNPLDARFYITEKSDALTFSWGDYSTFVNPPYSQISKWVDKCIVEFNERKDLSFEPCPIVMLVPARTDTNWFWKLVEHDYTQVYFLKGRLKFGGSKNSAPFPSCIVVFGKYFEDKHNKISSTILPKHSIAEFPCYILNLKNVL